MANVKISQLGNLADPASADVLPVTDVDTNITNKISIEAINKNAADGTEALPGIAFDLDPSTGLRRSGTNKLHVVTGATDRIDFNEDGSVLVKPAVTVNGLASLDGGIDVDGAFTVADTSGNIATSGTLGVDGQSTLASAAISDLTSGRVVLAGTSGELEDSAGLTFNGTQLDVDGDVVITGDLTVEGASTILETETVKVEDKNIELGVVASPTDVTADGGGITLKGSTDKTINWVDATDAWTFSEHIDLASAKEYRIAGVKVLDATSLGSGVVNSSLTSVGTISSGIWEGTAIAGTKIYPDFGAQTVATSGSYELLDASAYSVSVQQETLTSSQTLTIPDKTGTVAYVAGSNGQIPYNNAGAQDAANLFYNSSKGVFGYGLGGNTVFQATSKSTGVTINAPCGRIYMNGASLSADTTVTFTVTNSSVSLNDVVILNHAAGGTAGAYLLNAQAANNSFAINVTNISTGSLSEAIQISFAIIKANA